MFITAATFTIPWFREDMLRDFAGRVDDVVVLGNETDEKWIPYFEELGVRYRTYPVSRNGLNPISDVKTHRALKRIIAEECPDKVLTNFVKANVYGCIAAHNLGIKDIYVMMGGLGSVFHGDDRKSRLARLFVTAEYRASLKHAKKIFFQNDEDSKLLCDLGTVKSEQVVRIYGSGVNTEHFKQEPLPEQMSFVFIGRLVRGKGVLDYLDAARIVKREYPDVRFDLVGPYDTNPSGLKPEDIEPYIEDGTVVYHGEQKDVRPYLKSASCFVLPSYYGEGTPKSALEALATGRPLIVADAVGCREVVEDGINGFLVSPQDPLAIADAMTRLIGNRELLESMATVSRKLAERQFDVRQVNKEICETMRLGNNNAIEGAISLSRSVSFICADNGSSFQAPNIAKEGYNVISPYRFSEKQVFIRALRELWLKLRIPGKSLWNNPFVRNINTPWLIVFDSTITAGYIKWLSGQLPNTHIVLCYSNKISDRLDPYEVDGYCVQWSFDKEDCKRYPILNYSSTSFYFDHLASQGSDRGIKYDLVYVGRDKGRADKILALERACREMNLCFYYRIVPDHRYELYKRSYYKPAISYEDLLKLSRQSKAILSFSEGAQVSVTVRALEAAFNEIKLVTTDKNAYNYFFYDKDRVFILGVDEFEKLPVFLETPFPPVDKSDKNEWLFSAWVTKLISKTSVLVDG